MVTHVSSKDSGDLVDRIVKLGEEAGEVASAYGTYSGYKIPKKNMTKVQAFENIKEECIDSIIVCLDILTRDFDMTSDEIENEIAYKCTKWMEVVLEKRKRSSENGK